MDNNIVESNSSLNNLAVDVLKYYNIKPVNISIIQSGTIKTVWKVVTGNETLCLKRLKQTYDKALFSVNAQIYIKQNRGNVPSIKLDKNNKPIVEFNNQLFVVYEWLPGKDLDFNSSAGLQAALSGLARFHTASKGYIPADNSRVSSKLDKWPEQYNSMKNKFIAWKEIASTKSSLSNHASYFSCADPIIDIATLASELLEKSNYRDLVSQDSNCIVLCHQDYGKGNAILTDNGVYVLDLDGVTFDLPARDLRKIIGKQAENKGQWTSDSIENIINWYTQVNSMTEQEKEVLYIDLLFPHWFFGLVKNLYNNDKPVKASEIERIAKLEQSKVKVLNTFLKG